MSDETLKQIVEKLQGKALAHAINGQNYDKDGFYDLANHEYAMIEPYDDAIKTVIQVVQAEPVVHGEWLPTRDSNKKECSNCGVIHLIAQYPHGQANYCPNCGAKMKAGGQSE